MNKDKQEDLLNNITDKEFQKYKEMVMAMVGKIENEEDELLLVFMAQKSGDCGVVKNKDLTRENVFNIFVSIFEDEELTEGARAALMYVTIDKLESEKKIIEENNDQN